MMVVSELVAGLIFLQFALAGADTVSMLTGPIQATARAGPGKVQD